MRITLNALKKYAEESARIAKNCEETFRKLDTPEGQKYADQYHGESNAFRELFEFLNGDLNFGKFYDIVVNKKL